MDHKVKVEFCTVEPKRQNEKDNIHYRRIDRPGKTNG